MPQALTPFDRAELEVLHDLVRFMLAGATAASLALGRFVFLPFQRDNVGRQGLGESQQAQQGQQDTSSLSGDLWGHSGTKQCQNVESNLCLWKGRMVVF